METLPTEPPFPMRLELAHVAGKITTFSVDRWRDAIDLVNAAETLGFDYELLKFRHLEDENGEQRTEYRMMIGYNLEPDVDEFSDEVE